MLVFVNPSDKTVTICDKTVQVFSWSQFQTITYMLENKKVIYVTDAVETTGDEVLDVIYSSLSEEDIGDQTVVDSGELYFHATCKGKTMFVYNGKEYMFKGREDFHPIDSLPEGMLEKCKAVIDGVKSGLFEIVGEYERQKILNECNQEKELKNKKIDKKPERVISAKEMAAGIGRESDGDATVIELGDE